MGVSFLRALFSLLRSGRSLPTLLFGIFIFHAGWYLVLPFAAILFTSRRGLSPAQVGLLLAVQSFSLLAGSLIGGILADWLGDRTTMVAGLLLRGAGLAALGLFPSLPAMLLAAGTAGIGGGFYGPAAKAGIASLAPGEEQAAAFAARGIAANVGTSVGPLLGGLLLRGPIGLLFGIAGALHLGMAALTMFGYRPPSTGGPEEAAPWWAVLADRRYLAFSLVTAAAWALFAQLAIAMPLYAREVLGLEASVGMLWTLISLTVILFQFGVTRLSTRYLSQMGAMAAGALLLGAGLALVGRAGSFAGLAGALVLFVAGEMLLMPTADAAVSTFAGRGSIGSYFGIATVAWGLGEGVGNLVGGRAIQAGLARPGLLWPWAGYAAGGLLIAGLYFGMRRWAPRELAAETGLAEPRLAALAQAEPSLAEPQAARPSVRMPTPAAHAWPAVQAEPEWPSPGSMPPSPGILLPQETGPEERQEGG